jgi:membrane-bound serine protease (ClpP class)
LAILPLFVLSALFAQTPPESAQEQGTPALSEIDEVNASRRPAKIFVIPVRDQIGKPILYILRTGVKAAISAEAEFIVLDMETPGGRLDVTLEMMEILDRFDGTTVTFINDEAISAGAFISAATDKIYFSPSGVIGAAAPVGASGEDIQETMQKKIVSYLRARVRSISEDHPLRGEVISAMIDSDYELKVGDIVIKEKGELLSLTASEAMKEYGEPPVVLLGAGIVEDLAELYKTLAGDRGFETQEYEITWSVRLAQWLTALSPMLLGLGGLLLFIEFKTPGFGVFGVGGIMLLLVVFFGHHVAGLSGYEAAIVFMLGALLVLTELLFFPGLVFPAVIGLLLMFGSLVWGMADSWPNEPLNLSGDVLARPLANLGMGMFITILMALALIRFLPSGWFWQHLAIQQAVAGSAQASGGAPAAAGGLRALVGQTGTAMTDLFPSGQIEIAGRRYEARTGVQSIPRGTSIVVTGCTDFGLMVERKSS